VFRLKYFPVKARNFARTNPSAVRYIIDGLFVASAINIAVNNFSLLAIRLGTNDFQLSLIQFLPQILTMLVLIPGGLYMDSLQNKKRIVIVMLAAIMFGYLLCSISPFAGKYSIPFFLGSLTFAGVATALYNIAWQSFFPNVIGASVSVKPGSAESHILNLPGASDRTTNRGLRSSRNQVLTLRARVSLFISMLAPLLIGIVLASIGTVDGKIKAHQVFFFCSILLLFFAALNFKKFKTRRRIEPKRISLAKIKKAGKSLLSNKPFLLFTATALFFHITWHFDWTLYFIGQVHYLHMNEFQLGLAPLGGAAIQFLTIRFWSRMNERRGVVLPFTFGILGLSLCPAFMIAAVSMPASVGPHIFVILHTIAHIPFCVVTLNLFQCLLQVVDDENTSFYISVFACVICLSNAVMPVAGVALYHKLGADLNGLRYTLGIAFILRIIAAGLWLLRWRRSQEIGTHETRINAD